jgi:hypothetical protein
MGMIVYIDQKKIILALATMMFSFVGVLTLSLEANEPCYSSNCCPQVCCDAAPTCDWAYNPPGHQTCHSKACNSCSNNFTGRVDFLWWRPCSEGTQLGISNDSARTGSEGARLVTNETHIRSPNFKFDPGFRLGLGYYCPSKCWDVTLNWMHFHSKARAEGISVIPKSQNEGEEGLFGAKSSDLESDGLFISDWLEAFNLPVQEAKSRWSLDMDLIDLEFAQMFYVNHCFIVRPHVGLRGARIDQNYHVEQSLNTALGLGGTTFSEVVKSKNDFKGCGPRAGLDVEFHLGCGFVLYGKGAASLVYGQFNRDSRTEGTSGSSGLQFPSNAEFTYLSKGNNDRCTVPMSEVSIGLKWENCFECCNNYHPYALEIAWEQNVFYDINHFSLNPVHSPVRPRVEAFAAEDIILRQSTKNVSRKTGNLSTQGITVTATIGF